MKKTTLLVGAFLCAICSFAQGEYPINWDKETNLTATRADRVLRSITLTTENADPQVVEIGATGVVYNDLSDTKFNVQPGEALNFKINYSGTWMHSYYYVDVNKDGQFEWNDITPGQPGSELLGYAFWSGNITNENTGYSSDGTFKSGDSRANIDSPAFNAPEQPGEYRMRVKIDWNCIDPAGQYGSNYSGNFINANGGYIVDFTLVVEGAAPVVPEYNTTTKFFTAPELRAEVEATGKALIGIAGVTTTANKYINGKAYNGVLASEEGTLEGLRAPQEDEVLEVIATEGGYLLRQADAAEGEGYLKCAAGQNFTTSVAADANVWSILGPGEDGYGDITGWDDLYSDIDHNYNENMVRFISNGQYLNGQNRDGVGGLRGGKGAWSFNYVYNANYEQGETPVDPEPPVVEPEELTWSTVEAGNIYAIVNLQPTGNNFYLDYLDGNLSPVSAAECNTLFEWPETAKFEAVALANGRFAFKNCGTGNYLAWKGTANRNNTTGVYNNQGYDPAINEHSSWTLNESTRYEGAYWLRAEQRNDIPGDGQNLTGSPIIGNDGAWNAWTTGEYLPANGTAFSNSFAFYLVKKGEAPVEPVYDYAAAIAPVLAEANEVLEGHDNVWVTTYSENLITRNNQFSSPYTETREGSINNLIDGNQNSYWHSSWAASVPNHTHYIQVELDEAISGDVLATMSRRVNVANDHCVLMGVEASLDGVNYVTVGQMEFPYTGTPATQQATFNLAEEAKYLRFYNDKSNGSYQRGYWHMSEFQLNSFSTDLNVDAPDYAYPTAVKDLQDAIAATPAANGTKEDVEALQAAIEAYKAALAGYPEFTEWNGEIAINAGEVKTIDDLLNVDFIFNRAANIERGYSVLGAIFDQTGDAYGLVLDGFCGDVDYKTVKNAELVAKVASVEFAKISDFVGDIQAQAKAAAAKIGAFQPEAGHAYVLLASKSFLVDGELFNEFKKFDCTLATGVITGVETIVVPASEVMFDLQGRRTNSTNGLRILNGRVVR